MVGLNDTDTHGFRVRETTKHLWPNRGFSLTKQHCSSTISKQDMTREVLIARLVELGEIEEIEFFRVNVCSVLDIYENFQVEMDYFESGKEAVLRTSILEQWNIQTRANLHVELVVDGGGEINSGCTVDVYVSEIEDTRWDIPAAERGIPDSHLSFEEMIDKISVPDSIDQKIKHLTISSNR